MLQCCGFFRKEAQLMTLQPSLPSVLLLSESESLAALDRRALREVGVTQIQVMTSGIAAARILAGLAPNPGGLQPDVIVCAQKLEDMDGERFCAILRLHPRLLAMPVLLILPSDSEVEQLKTLGCGASALLGRPYSVTDLKATLAVLEVSPKRLPQLQKAARYTDTKAFDAALDTYGLLLKPVRQPEDYFRVGMQDLQQQRWNNAINAFQRALRDAQIKGEAELGMAVAWKGKGDLTRYRACLAQAAATFVRAGHWRRARAVHARVLQEDPGAKSPFLAEARQLMRQGLYDEAAEILAQGFEVTSKSQLCDKIAQTCLTSEEPEHMLRQLERSLGRALGAQGDRLGSDIRTCLDELIRQQEARRREAAAERQWSVSRRMARQREMQEGAAQESADSGAEQAKEPTGEEKTEPRGTAPETGAPSALTALAGRARTSRVTVSGVVSPQDGDRPALMPLDEDAAASPRGSVRDSASRLPVVEPLSETEATSKLFTGKPRLNELLSVMKCTWKLVRRDK